MVVEGIYPHIQYFLKQEENNNMEPNNNNQGMANTSGTQEYQNNKKDMDKIHHTNHAIERNVTWISIILRETRKAKAIIRGETTCMISRKRRWTL